MQRKMTLHLPDLKATLHSGQKAALHSGQREALHWGQRVALLGSLAHHSWAEARLRAQLPRLGGPMDATRVRERQAEHPESGTSTDSSEHWELNGRCRQSVNPQLPLEPVQASTLAWNLPHNDTFHHGASATGGTWD